LPPLAWQTYDIDIAGYDEAGKKTERKINIANGIVIHAEQKAARPATNPKAPAAGLFLQNHGTRAFRNI
jgi:hypothetical protein